jgi:predicted PurR-regulated permease PerM
LCRSFYQISVVLPVFSPSATKKLNEIIYDKQKRIFAIVLITLGLLVLFLLLSYLLKSAMEVMLLIFAGILFAIFIRGLSGFLFSKFKIIPDQLRIVITLLLLISALSTFIIFLAPQLAEQAEKLAKQLPEALESIREEIGSLSWLEEMLKSSDNNSNTPQGGISALEVTLRF